MGLKEKNNIRKLTYNRLTRNFVVPMFLHNTDNYIKTELIERMLINYGFIAIGKKNEKYYPFVPALTGNLDYDGLGDTVIGTSLNGIYFEGSREEFPIMYNNSMYTCDFTLLNETSDIISEVVKSMISNIKLCRIKSSISCASENEKKQAEKILDDIESGKLLTVLLDKSKIASGKSAYELIKLADEKDIDKLQYLTKYLDDIIRILSLIYGIPINSSGKMAQMNNKELSGYEHFCKIYPIDRFYQRKIFYEQFNKVHGTNWGVEYNEPWKTIIDNKDVESLESESEVESDVI